ncbi:hypothetical protein C7377_1034 [Balneicella halophila]|uniref:Lipoprotein n=1 Tax=Balneicella halophila TaxID=1537566 RepID=A0A7L4UNQ0_BALHA|nr:hypothetical protein [Balneicella halophila]PVX50721.1 hypothetical protein C7377_1034 [Balneicella halophila]
MKRKNFLLIVVVGVLLTGCVVKSLKPFYTEDTLAYDASLIGRWKDDKNQEWEIVSMEKALGLNLLTQEFDVADEKLKVDEFQNKLKKIENNKNGEMIVKSKKVAIFGDNEKSENGFSNSIDSVLIVDGKVTISKGKDTSNGKEENEIYKNAYIFMTKGKNDKEFYLAVPFKIKGQLFLDFTPFNIEGVNGLSDFAGMHYVGIHTLAKLDKKGDDLEIAWLSESKIQELFEQKKIRIAHEKIGIENDEILLTASSEDLQKFIAKYMDSPDAEKWTTSVKRALKRIK